MLPNALDPRCLKKKHTPPSFKRLSSSYWPPMTIISRTEESARSQLPAMDHGIRPGTRSPVHPPKAQRLTASYRSSRHEKGFLSEGLIPSDRCSACNCLLPSLFEHDCKWHFCYLIEDHLQAFMLSHGLVSRYNPTFTSEL
jgi:hypothetical protein